jgi:hypothetical protein
MNPPSGPRPQKQQQQQKQKQKTLIIKKPENTLDFHSRLIEAAEVRFSRHAGKLFPLLQLPEQLRSLAISAPRTFLKRTSGAKALIGLGQVRHG